MPYTNNKSPLQLLESILLKFHVDNETLHKVTKLLNAEMDKAATVDGGAPNSVKMLPTFVRTLPNGTEMGSYLALDLGGTKFRVLLITLKGINFVMKSEVFDVPQTIMVGSGKALFDHIAACLAKFITSAGLSGQKLNLGFTFSFPCVQDDLASGRLIHWTKGFKCSRVEGEDVVRLLQEAINRRQDIRVDVVALLNDTVGTLMATAHTDHKCRIGVIVGTGTNACYVENVARCPKLARLALPQSENMIINVEWGAFGGNGILDFLLNEYDAAVDEASINPGQQIFEKAVSGMYLGELVRLVLCDLHRNGIVLKGQNIDGLHVKDSFLTKYVSSIEHDNLNHAIEFPKTRKVLNALGIQNASTEDCEIVVRVNRLVARRSANLFAAALVALIKRMNLPLVNIGCDGSVYKLHPSYKTMLESKLEDLLETHNRVRSHSVNLNFQVGRKFTLKLSEDGSGRGAALVAAVACRLNRDQRRAPAAISGSVSSSSSSSHSRDPQTFQLSGPAIKSISTKACASQGRLSLFGQLRVTTSKPSGDKQD